MEQEQDNKNFFAIIIAGAFIGLGIFLSGFINNPKVETAQVENSISEQDQTNFDSDRIKYSEVETHVGEDVCVVGKVDKVYISKSGTVFFDYCKDYSTCPFTAVVFKSDAKKFGDFTIYNGKTIELKGLIKSYKGKPEIIINGPEQIKIID
jgi:DNA/RNA endonuclease YhcR with UshA esterase domain